MRKRKLKLPRLVLLSFLTGLLVSCSQGPVSATKPAPVPVLPYGRDLVGGPQYYIVKKGDTLYSIGFRSGYGYRTLALWNNIKPPYKLVVGQKIKLFEPPPKQPVVKEKPAFKGPSAKKRNSSQKKPIFSTDNKNLLKLHWHWPITGTLIKRFSQSGSKGIDISDR